MKRFFTVLAAVALAGAIYVATAPGSQTVSPTAKQFNALAKQFKALKLQVGKLQKDEAAVKQLAMTDALLLTDCMAHSVPIGQYGDDLHGFAGTFGYTYTDPALNGGASFLAGALDLADPADPNAAWITYGSKACGTDLPNAVRKMSRLAGIHLHSAPLHAFSTHRR
jgi:hypothetical protein